MREHERRELLVIEQNLRAEAPELEELFARLAEPRWPTAYAGGPSCVAARRSVNVSGSRSRSLTSGPGELWPYPSLTSRIVRSHLEMMFQSRKYPAGV
jgi:hypothetical protein